MLSEENEQKDVLLLERLEFDIETGKSLICFDFLNFMILYFY